MSSEQLHAEHTVVVETSLFSVDAVKRALYRLAARCSGSLATQDSEHIAVTLRLTPPLSDKAVRELEADFHRELIDEDLRERIRAETAPIRALLMAHAFSRTGLIGDDE